MQTKVVKLPSGLEVTIKKPGILALRAVHGVLPILGSEQTNGEKRDAGKELDASIRMVCMCCTKPQFTDSGEDGKTDIDELDLADFSALAQEITQFSGFEEAAQKLRPLSETSSPS